MAVHLIPSPSSPLLAKPYPILPGQNLSAPYLQRPPIFWWNDPIASQDQMRPGARIPWVGATRARGTPAGLGSDCTANDQGIRGTAPTHINGLIPCTLVVVFWQVATPSSHGRYFGVTYTSTDTGSVYQYCIQTTSTPDQIQLAWNSAGTARVQNGTGGLPSNGALHTIVWTHAAASHIVYLDGISGGEDTNAASAPTYVTPQVCIGTWTSDVTTRNPGAVILDARIYDYIWTAQQARQFSDAALRWSLYPSLDDLPSCFLGRDISSPTQFAPPNTLRPWAFTPGLAR